MRRTPEERFWGLVEKGESCWEWKTKYIRRSTGKLGPGRFWDGNRIVEAPRWSWENANGQMIPEGLLVRHRCDNPPCVRPEHLVIGTHADNHNDMVIRGRSLKGSRHHRAKLNEDRVREIKRRLAAGERQADLHREFGVSRMAISDIALGKRWGWLD
jgi:hypothetical protein